MRFFISVISERTLSMEEVTNDTLKDDFTWSSLMGEDHNDDSWNVCRTQELVTDLTHSGDPSTYLTTPTERDLVANTHLPSTNMMHNHHAREYQYNSINLQQQHVQQLPSIESIHQKNHQNNSESQVMFHGLELSPASSKLDEELFPSPEYSESSNDESDNLPSLDIHQNHQHQQHINHSTSAWSTSSTNSTTSTLTYHPDNISNQQHIIYQGDPLAHQNNGMKFLSQQNQHGLSVEEQQQMNLSPLPSMSSFRVEELSTLTPLEPVAATSVIVQDAHAHCWGDDYPWDESKTLSMLDANLDFDHLIDLDAL